MEQTEKLAKINNREGQTPEKRTNSTLDLLKIIMAFFIMAKHADVFPEVVEPWVRITVPLFFVMSSYFFFGGLKKATDSVERTKRLKKYVLRNLELYLFWFIVLFPITVFSRHFFDEGVVRGLVLLIQNFFFGMTFLASWFIVAQVIAIVILFFAVKKLNNIVLLVISFLIFAAATLMTSYRFLFEGMPGVIKFIDGYQAIFLNPAASFPIALFWCTVGKIFAEKTVKIPKAFSACMAIAGAVALYLERKYLFSATQTVGNDSMFSLALLCPFLFELILGIETHLKCSAALRKMSVIIYCAHYSIIAVLEAGFKRLHFPMNPLLIYVLCAALCVLLCFIIFKLEKFEKLKWLKYSH